MKLVFASIKNGTIFEPEFQALNSANGTIEFKHRNAAGGLAVVYAPNGTGKSSLSRTLGEEQSSDEVSFSAVSDSGIDIKPETMLFHIIPDQINRNVIPGKETDYLVGYQIKREYELRDRINKAFDNAYSDLADKYRREFMVSKVGGYLLTQIKDLRAEPYSTAYSFLRSIINVKYRGKNIQQDQFVDFIRNNKIATVELDENKRWWVINDCSGYSRLVEKMIGLNYESVVSNNEAALIERHDDAIGILEKYHTFDFCIVCDNHDFHGEELLSSKRAKRQHIYESLDLRTKELLDNIVNDNRLSSSDPFDIKRIVREFISTGDETELHQLQIDLLAYTRAIGNEMIDALLHCFDNTSLLSDFDEYTELVSKQPELDSEELLFIKDIINENIGKDITIDRDKDSRNYKLKLGGMDLLNTARTEMKLSSGEQNFISLAFELLMARHSDKEYVVLDDPISSFDSVYKNKIAFCIIKFLEGKKQLVLTHNTDLVRLLDVQLNNSFNLYILNNVENGKNGFIPVNAQEKALLINLHELVKLFQNKYNVERGDISLVHSIKNRRLFLMSMIPFMRGYAHISLDVDDDFGTLSNIMHGYSKGSVDIVPIYKKLFGYDFGGTEIISVNDVLNVDCRNLDIIDEEYFPLLADTLRQTLVYYHLRMKVEWELVDAFGIPIRGMETLNQIIQKAFRCAATDPDFELKREFRVFFTSRKTLLNEFNHFEGNMNIFQPAIDINPMALRKEIEDIEAKLIEVRAYANGVNGTRGVTE